MKVKVSGRELKKRIEEDPLFPEIVKRTKEIEALAPGLRELEELIKKDFTPEKLLEMVADLCHAEDVKMSQSGEYRTPNWTARKDGFREVMDLLKYKRKEAAQVNGTPSKIVFQIVNAPQSGK